MDHLLQMWEAMSYVAQSPLFIFLGVLGAIVWGVTFIYERFSS